MTNLLWNEKSKTLYQENKVVAKRWGPDPLERWCPLSRMTPHRDCFFLHWTGTVQHDLASSANQIHKQCKWFKKCSKNYILVLKKLNKQIKKRTFLMKLLLLWTRLKAGPMTWLELVSLETKGGAKTCSTSASSRGSSLDLLCRHEKKSRNFTDGFLIMM